MNAASRGLLYGVLAVFFWGTAATAFKLTLSFLQPAELLSIASFTTVILLFGFLVLQKRTREIFSQPFKVYRQSAFLGLLNPFLYYLILFQAYSLIPAQIAQPLNFIWPIVLVFLSVWILKQSITKYQIIALGISFLGVLVISLQGKFSFDSVAHPEGLLLAAGSSIIWALYWIYNMKQPLEETLGLFLNFLFSSVYIAIYLLIKSNIHFPSFEGLMGGVYVGCFEMGITFVLWLKALNYSGSAARVGNLIYLTPFLSLVWIHFILGEKIYFTTFGGLILIVLGLIINKRK